MVGKKGPRKLLVASAGVATINYVLAGCDTFSGATVANLPAPQGGAFVGFGGKAAGGTPSIPPIVANLPAPMGGFPPFAGSGGQTTAGSAGMTQGGVGGESPGGAGGEASGGETSGGEPSTGGVGGAP